MTGPMGELSPDILQLVAVLALLYASELVLVVRYPWRAFAARGGRGRLFGSGLVIEPLAPWRLCGLVGAWPVHIGARGVYAYLPHRVRAHQPEGWGHRGYGYEAIRGVTHEGTCVRVNGEPFFACATSEAAGRVVALLLEARDGDAAARARLGERILSDALDLAAAREAWHRLSSDTLALRLGATLLGLTVVASCAALLRVPELLAMWPLLLAFLGGQVLTMAALFWQSHRRHYPAARGERWQRVMLMLLTFPSAIRAASVVGRTALADRHYLALSKAWLTPAAWQAELEHAARCLAHPRPLDAAPSSLADLAEEARVGRLRVLEQLARAAGLRRGALLAAPARESPRCVAYCPRCLAQFEQARTTCDDCGVQVALF